MQVWNNLSTWNSSLLDLRSIEVDLKKEKSLRLKFGEKLEPLRLEF